jgi:hypothetical protein
MDLDEGFLEDILGDRAVAQEPDQESEERPLVPIDERAEGRVVAVAIILEQLLIGAVIDEPQPKGAGTG